MGMPSEKMKKIRAKRNLVWENHSIFVANMGYHGIKLIEAAVLFITNAHPEGLTVSEIVDKTNGFLIEKGYSVRTKITYRTTIQILMRRKELRRESKSRKFGDNKAERFRYFNTHERRPGWVRGKRTGFLR